MRNSLVNETAGAPTGSVSSPGITASVLLLILSVGLEICFHSLCRCQILADTSRVSGSYETTQQKAAGKHR